MIRNVGRTLLMGAEFALPHDPEKPMTGLRAVGNSWKTAGLGMASLPCQESDGVLGNVGIADNTLIGKGTGVSRTAISVYPGTGSTTMMTNININGPGHQAGHVHPGLLPQGRGHCQ